MKKVIAIFLFCLSSSLIFAQETVIPEKPELILVEGGTFKMGSSLYEDSKPVHRIKLSSFSIGKYEIMVGQFKAFCTETGRSMPEAPTWGWHDNHPMVNVSWNDAVAYCNWLGEKFGGIWRLPTEAEWEYAARGASKSNGYIYAGGSDIETVGWYEDNSGGQTNSVGSKSPNELGLYDLSGNASEWCLDWYDERYYASSPSSNPKGPSSGPYRVLRGGSWYNQTSWCRITDRGRGIPAYRSFLNGFRVVLSQ